MSENTIKLDMRKFGMADRLTRVFDAIGYCCFTPADFRKRRS